MRTSISDLPIETLFRICEHLRPMKLEDILPRGECLFYYHDQRCPLRTSDDLISLGASCRMWNAVVMSSTSPCLSHKFRSLVTPHYDRGLYFINHSGQHFRETLWSLPHPEFVTHLHLSWSKPALLDLEVLTEPFPALRMLEIVDFRRRHWRGLARALAGYRILQMLNVKFRFEDMDIEDDGSPSLKAPTADDHLLWQVKKLCVVDRNGLRTMESFLLWLPGVIDLTLNTNATIAFVLSLTLQTCKRSLKVLRLDGNRWPSKSLLDLRPLNKLERFDVHTAFLLPDDFTYLRLPLSVRKIVYTAKNSSQQHLGTYEAEAFQYLARKRETVAPGLQRVLFRIATASGFRDRFRIPALSNVFHSINVTVVWKSVDQNLAWECIFRDRQLELL